MSSLVLRAIFTEVLEKVEVQLLFILLFVLLMVIMFFVLLLSIKFFFYSMLIVLVDHWRTIFRYGLLVSPSWSLLFYMSL